MVEGDRRIDLRFSWFLEFEQREEARPTSIRLESDSSSKAPALGPSFLFQGVRKPLKLFG